MLGINANGNNYKYIIANFLVFLAVAIIYEFGELLFLKRFPSVFECYEVVIKALIATFAIYGINRATHKET